MKLKTWLPIAVALVLGTFAALLARNGMSRTGPAAPVVKIVVANHAVAPGEALAADDLDLRAVGAEPAPAGAQTDPANLVGRTVAAQVLKGEPVLESHLAAEGAASGLQALVPAGMRAMTIEVNEFNAVGGMITPGARVDVLSTMLDAGNRETMSRTIAQNVLVKAVGQATGQSQDGGVEAKPVRSVTLLVTSKQAEALQLSIVAGRPWLVLRGQGDNATDASPGTTLAELRGAATPGIARSIFEALKPKQAALPPVTVSAPSTRPVFAEAPGRSVHTIRATVENTVTVPPLRREPADGGAGEVYTSTTVEP